MREAQEHRLEDIHSRSRLAGYQPDILAGAKVLVPGLGALGQNVVQNLALVGVGHLWLVDFDEFESQNATRSPYFPNQASDRSGGLSKAPIVARRARLANTAENPSVVYSETAVQLLGDNPIRWADVVVSAVDDVNARAWLAERCRLHARPMVEAGFNAFRFNVSAFSGRSGDPCYRCVNPSRISSGSCRLYARQAERQQIIPAIQTTAAVSAAYQAELVIALLHGENGLCGKRLFGNVRTQQHQLATLQTDPDCPGRHDPLPVGGAVDVGSISSLGELLDLLPAVDAITHVRLAEPLVLRDACTQCGSMCQVGASEAAWLMKTRCIDCGGEWNHASIPSPFSTTIIDRGTEDVDLVGVGLARLGLFPGGAIEVMGPGGSHFFELEGPPCQLSIEASKR